ncbi:vitamin B12 ABC transporter substrate-binding protein BtuF [Vibrio furnissii]|uniref:vitamin B12 ABC transporter substrate-binding protein BtuF n=1 Tax=Vibrio furnissii TaxID=29494 RepID=UPI002573E9ED|nr:vitamin B12 ABC transporter substrate-binding protein BtuF [Vibrio furnissii]WJG22088.1 vitamin B12 ABC transporter substrate-binding protein BtuF [Vibrio furnissii]
MRLWTLTLLCFTSISDAAHPVQRVISLAPHATELAFAAGLGDKLVAVSEYSDYPPQARQIEKVSNYQGVKVERIVALKPDLVIVWPGGNPARELDKLKQLGLPLYESNTRTLDDIATNIEQLSQYADDPTIGQRAADDFRHQLTTLRAQYADAKPVRYFYQLSEKPIITLAQGSWPSEVFRFCGGENVFERSPSPYPQVGLEQVLLAQPEVIFTSEHAIDNDNMWQRWQAQLPAVKQNHVWALTSDWLNRPTPRTLNAIQQVCHYFDQVRK